MNDNRAAAANALTERQVEYLKRRTVAFNRGGLPGPCGVCQQAFTSWKAKRDHLRAANCAAVEVAP